MISNTFHKWKEKNKNVRGASTYTTQPYKTNFMGLNQRSCICLLH
jgi:hypothetical protein